MSRSLAVIIPMFNEELGIAETLTELEATAKKRSIQIIVIDDGSTDKSADKVRPFEWVKLVRHAKNRGYGAALKSGIKAAEGFDYVAFYDADGQHHPADLERLLDSVGEADMLVGARAKGSHQPLIRKPGKKILSLFANFLSGTKIPDLNSGLRIMKRTAILSVLHLMPNGFSFTTTSTIAFFNLGYVVNYFPIQTRKRVGTSTVRQISHGTNTLLLILRMIVLFNPLKVFLPVSGILIATGVVYEVIYGIILYPTGPKLLAGAFFLILTGMIVFFFGLVVDQISEMRKQPFQGIGG